MSKKDKNLFEENKYDDFFSRFEFFNYTDKMAEFKDK